MRVENEKIQNYNLLREISFAYIKLLVKFDPRAAFWCINYETGVSRDDMETARNVRQPAS
jgi:hypothetical protein